MVSSFNYTQDTMESYWRSLSRERQSYLNHILNTVVAINSMRWNGGNSYEVITVQEKPVARMSEIAVNIDGIVDQFKISIWLIRIINLGD